MDWRMSMNYERMNVIEDVLSMRRSLNVKQFDKAYEESKKDNHQTRFLATHKKYYPDTGFVTLNGIANILKGLWVAMVVFVWLTILL